MAEYAAEIAELGEKIVALSLLQARQLSEYLKEKHGIEAAAGAVMMAGPAAAAAGAAAAPAAAEQTTFDVVLKAPGAKTIQIIKIVRAVTNLGLKEAKDLVVGAPKVVKAGVDRAEAEKLKKELEAEGATVELK
ncbi:MAG: 50S ribosomal protein L7/L12 [Planctomycetes bacterium]|nr:50S ribosomal protein L7/L12 [Planctomycetota bacterium]